MMNPNDRDNASSSSYVLITEQPAPKSIKFRYKSEPSRGGLIFGANNTAENRSFPKIRVVGYKGSAWVRVTCVTIDPPYRTHPHNLVGRMNCSEGICQMAIGPEEMIAEFPNLGIQCVKKNDVETELKLREAKNIDPFKAGFEHCSNVSSINLNALRLCFEVFIPTADMQTWIPLEPIVSDPIYDKKAKSDLVITRLSHFSASAKGGEPMILLCENVDKDNVVIRFFDEKNWEDFGIFEPEDVHKQVAIYFKTPPYYNPMIKEKVKVNIQLRRKTDINVTSESRPFSFVPDFYESKWPVSTVPVTNSYTSRVKPPGIDSRIRPGPSSRYPPPNYFPNTSQSIANPLGIHIDQLQSEIGLNQNTGQLPPIQDILVLSKNEHSKNGNERNINFPNESQGSVYDLFDENMMSIMNCDQLTDANRCHDNSESNRLPASPYSERLEETQPPHSNVADVYTQAFYDPSFSFLHSYKNLNYAAIAESSCQNSRNEMSFQDLCIIANNNMETLSESLSSSLSMST